MNDQLARSLFMDYLYDEISDAEKSKLESYLADNPELEQELTKLKQTRSLLQQMPEAEPNQQLLMMEPRERSFSQWWQEAKNLLPRSFFGKTAIAAAAVVLLLFTMGSVMQLHIDTAGNGIAVSLGYSPTVNKGLSTKQADALVNQIRKENAAMLSEYAKSINEQQEERMQKIVTYFEQQRMNDLRLVNQTLDELQQNTNYRLRQTNQYLGEMLQTVSYQNRN